MAWTEDGKDGVGRMAGGLVSNGIGIEGLVHILNTVMEVFEASFPLALMTVPCSQACVCVWSPI